MTKLLKAFDSVVGRERYTHDCEECIYLGTTIAGNRTEDLYYHAEPQSFIARYGNDGPEYVAGDAPATYGQYAAVTVARLLAEQAGLTVSPEAPVGELSASEAVYAFAGWLTGGGMDHVALGAHDPSQAAELVGAFCKSQGFADPRHSWHKAIKPYPAPTKGGSGE